MRRRIVALYLVLAVIVSSLVAFITYRYSSQMLIKEIETGLRHEAILIERILGINSHESITDELLEGLSEILVSRDTDSGGKAASRRITVVGKDGRVLADSKVNSNEMKNHSDRQEVIDAIKNRIGTDVRRSETTGASMVYLAYYSENMDLVVRISGSLEQINDIGNTILLYAVAAVLAAMVISVLIALKLSAYVLKPLARLVKEYAYLPNSQKGFSGREDEIDQLSLTLSSMTRHIENTIKELQDRNARVNTIINSMDSGLIAVDRSMNILMINPVARKFFGFNEKSDLLIGIPLIHAVRNRRINDLLMKAIASNRAVSNELSFGKRIFSIHVSPIHSMDNEAVNSGALAYINDITQVRKLEEMRSEFVSNVTHELKTPLTSIQGFVETLKSGAIKDASVAERFLDIIDIEADRLRTLINDILELSEIERLKQDKEIQVFSVYPVVEEVESMLHNYAADKDITLKNHASPHAYIKANRYRFKQLMINLMDNAVKYNKPGGSVEVRTEIADGKTVIHVTDTGIGINEAHAERIFERFYRVDKGRSREMGGTGLGLSIVKHIAQLYGGSVKVVSQEGLGSDFIVTLPGKD